jgi:hypothetical protein
MADAEQRGSDTDERNALQARVDYAKSLIDWVNQAPQPPRQQTAAKTYDEAIGEILGELARIRACFNIKGAQDWLNEHDPDVITSPPQDYIDWWEEQSEKVEESAKAWKCPGAP